MGNQGGYKMIELQIRYFPSEADFEFSENFLNNLAYWKAQRDMEKMLNSQRN